MTRKQLKANLQEIESQIRDGAKPLCPLCGDQLSVKKKAVGLSGAAYFNYRCSNKECKLRPSTTRASFYQVIWQALQQRFVQLAVAAIASVSVASLIPNPEASVHHLEPSTSGARNYSIESSTLIYDMSGWRPGTVENPSVVKADRFDRVRQLLNNREDFRLVAATNGDSLILSSSSHSAAFRAKELEEGRFKLDLKHTYEGLIPASEIPVATAVPIHIGYSYRNSFQDETNLWVGSRPSYKTDHLTLIVQLPEGKRCRGARGFLKPTSDGPRDYPGPQPVISEDRTKIVWTVANPDVNVGYAIHFEW